MSAQTYATPPQRMVVNLHQLFLNQGLSLDPTDISSRRRLRAQDLTDLDQDSDQNLPSASASPIRLGTRTSLALVPMPEACRTLTVKRGGEQRARVKTENHRVVPQHLGEVASLWYELEDRSKPSISSF